MKQQDKEINCECVCHTIVPLKKGEAYPRQFDRPIECEHCTRETTKHQQDKEMFGENNEGWYVLANMIGGVLV